MWQIREGNEIPSRTSLQIGAWHLHPLFPPPPSSTSGRRRGQAGVAARHPAPPPAPQPRSTSTRAIALPPHHHHHQHHRAPPLSSPYTIHPSQPRHRAITSIHHHRSISTFTAPSLHHLQPPPYLARPTRQRGA
ncbi:hypothetical protein VPH35_074249 [Triticum aestivum]